MCCGAVHVCVCGGLAQVHRPTHFNEFATLEDTVDLGVDIDNHYS